jgi:hypothetical protein
MLLRLSGCERSGENGGCRKRRFHGFLLPDPECIVPAPGSSYKNQTVEKRRSGFRLKQRLSRKRRAKWRHRYAQFTVIRKRAKKNRRPVSRTPVGYLFGGVNFYRFKPPTSFCE